MNTDELNDVKETYDGSDGTKTTLLYNELYKRGPVGVIAVNLFRAHKASARAKVYRGGIRGKGSYKNMAYDRKNWALQNLVTALCLHGDALGIPWGWKHDPNTPGYEWILYVVVGPGQVSFHSGSRLAGPDFSGEWDGVTKVGDARVILFCCEVLYGEEKSQCEALSTMSPK